MKKCSPTAPPLNNLPWAQSAICLCSIYSIHRCGSWVSVMWIVLNRGAQLPSVLQWKHMVNLWRSFFFFFFSSFLCWQRKSLYLLHSLFLISPLSFPTCICVPRRWASVLPLGEKKTSGKTSGGVISTCCAAHRVLSPMHFPTGFFYTVKQSNKDKLQWTFTSSESRFLSKFYVLNFSQFIPPPLFLC